MSQLNALRARKAEIARACNKLLADKGDQVWSKEDQETYDAHMQDLSRISAQIKAWEDQQNDEAKDFFAGAGQAPKGDAAEKTQAAARETLKLFFSRKLDDLSAEERQAVRNTMSTTTGSEGGFTVPKFVAKELFQVMKAFGGMRDAAQIIPTDSGNDMDFPGSDGTAEEGSIVGQNSQANNNDPTFINVALNTFKYSSDTVAIPWELIADSAVDVVAMVIERLGTRIGRIHNRHFTVGTGTGQPFGIVTRAGSGRVCATGSTTTCTYDDLKRLYHSVNSAYRLKAKFMMNDNALLMLSLIKDTAGRPIFVPGFETGNPGGAPDKLLGVPVIVNDHMADPAANAKSIVFGDLSTYKIRDVTGSVFTKVFDDSKYAEKGQRGFCAWARAGGNLLDVQAVKFLQHSAS